MKKEELFEILGDMNDRYVKAAHETGGKKYGLAWTGWRSVAACLAVLVGISVVTGVLFQEEKHPSMQETSSVLTDDTVQESFHNDNRVEDLQMNTSLKETAEESETGKGFPETMEEESQGEVPADPAGKYSEAVNDGGLNKEIFQFYGGAYMNADGSFVVVLTEDTAENRATICKELGRSENETIFVQGTYTLAYLTELQAKISTAMVKKELPFVTMSGVYEDANCIIVCVTTDDDTELAKIYALDPIGGAIRIEQGDGLTTAVTEEKLSAQ